MCQSKAQGGRRCASHLYPAYAKAMEEYHKTNMLTPENISAITLAARAYASTPFGAKKINSDIEKFYSEEVEGLVIEDSIKSMISISQSIYEGSGMVALLNESLKKGYELSREYDLREQEIKQASIMQISTASPELCKALEEQNLSLDTFFTALRVAKALGADIPVLEGSSIFEVTYTTGSYDTYYEGSLGYYPTYEQANKVIEEHLFRVSEDEEETPWGNIKDFDNPLEWENKRLDFFRNHFDEARQWFASDRYGTEGETFEIKTHQVGMAPDVSWKIN